jgi:hypothetical protein
MTAPIDPHCAFCGTALPSDDVTAPHLCRCYGCGVEMPDWRLDEEHAPMCPSCVLAVLAPIDADEPGADDIRG